MLFLLSGIIGLYFNNFQYFFAFALGYFTHLSADMLNYKGIMLFCPFSKKKIKGFIKTGSITEKIIFIVCLIAGFILLLYK